MKALFGGSRNTTTLSVVVMLVAAVGALGACQATTAQAQAGATCEQFGQTPTMTQSARIAVGEELAVGLCSNPSTGYSWEQPEIADAAVVKVVDSTYHAPGASLPGVGAAGGQVLTVRGLAAGQTTVLVRYSRPWAGG